MGSPEGSSSGVMLFVAFVALTLALASGMPLPKTVPDNVAATEFDDALKQKTSKKTARWRGEKTSRAIGGCFKVLDKASILLSL